MALQDSGPPDLTVATLLSAPRGRRLVLEYAVAVQEQLNLGGHNVDVGSLDYGDPVFLGTAVMTAGRALDPDAGSSRIFMSFSSGGTPDGAADPQVPQLPQFTPLDVAHHLAAVQLGPVTEDLLTRAVDQSVAAARYWQAPDGEDFLTLEPAVLKSLERVAKHILASNHTHWWSSAMDPLDQWEVDREEKQLNGRDRDDQWVPLPRKGVAQALQFEHDDTIASEEESAKQRALNPAEEWSGQWWSVPAWDLTRSARSTPDGSPCQLNWREDSGRWEHGSVRRLAVPPQARIFEIHGPNDWAHLCRSYGTEVTAQRRDDWFATTGRRGRWVMPDWLRVSQDFDGVYLSVAGYLTAAGVAVAVDRERASVIAGWDPDTTYWFTEMQYADQEPVVWTLVETAAAYWWARATP